MSKSMAEVLAEALYDRGGVVPDWPDDERDLYREVSCRSFVDANAAVAKLRYQKAEAALIAAGYGPAKTPPALKRISGELRALRKHLDSWQSQEHSTVTITYLRAWVDARSAELHGRD